jgi:hypothetical protein
LAIQLLKRRLVSRNLGISKKDLPAAKAQAPTQTKPKLPYPEFTVKQD